MNKIKIGLLFVIVINITGCKAFMYGFTQDLAYDSYMIVNTNEKNFGNRRIKYNLGMRKNSELDIFLHKKGNPDFIYEYEAKDKSDVIELFYVKTDSVYIFQEPKKSNVCSILRNSRLINDSEKLIYSKLLNK